MDGDKTADNQELLKRLKDGDSTALGELIDQNRERLRQMIELRLDSRLSGRISCSDVLQEVCVDAIQRIGHFVSSDIPFHIWLRMLASQRLVDIHRHHLGAQMRDAACEVSLNGRACPQVSSVCLAACIAGSFDSPSQLLIRKEQLAAVEQALEQMDPIDREVLTMRHLEEMENDDIAIVLGLTKSAASKRYVRALRKLKDVFAQLHGEVRDER